jgi:O-antigen/teichoic acid export membrane protein
VSEAGSSQERGGDDGRPGPPDTDVVGIARGTGFLAGGSFFDFAARFVIGILLARLLGPADYGLYQLATSAAALFAGVSSLGLDDAMVRYVAILSARRDRPGVWGSIQIGVGLAVPVAVAMGVVLFLTAPTVAEGLFDEPALTPLLRLMAFVVPFLTLSNVLLGISRGFGRMDHAAFGENVVQPVVRVVLLSVLAVVGLDVFAAVLVFGIADVASAVAFVFLIDRGFPLRPSKHVEARRDLRGVFGFALPLWISGLINQFRRNIQVFFLGTMASTASVGVFAIVAQVNLIGHAVYRAMIVAVKPLLAQMHDRGDRTGLAHIYTTTSRWLILSNVPFFLAMVLYPSSILGLFGEGFEGGATALAVMATAELVNAATGICGSLVDMTGHTRVKVANSVLLVAVLGGANLLLVPRYGVLGAALAYLVGIAVVNVARMLEIWILERVLPSWRAYAKPMVAGTAAFGFGWALQVILPVGDALLPALGQGIAVVSVYVGLVWLLGIDDADRAIIARLVRKVRRRAEVG